MVSLTEMVDSESNLHLNALVDWMQLLCIASPQEGDFEDWFHGADIIIRLPSAVWSCATGSSRGMLHACNAKHALQLLIALVQRDARATLIRHEILHTHPPVRVRMRVRVRVSVCVHVLRPA